MEALKHLINVLSAPQVLFTFLVLVFFFIFPVNDWFWKWHRKLKIGALWSKRGGIVLHALLFLFFLFGITDDNFRKIVFKPDNVPIAGLIFLVTFFLWFSMYQAYKNDSRLERSEKPAEFHDPSDKVLVWPDLVQIELIASILGTALLLIWGIGLDAPLEEPANPADSPNPSKAPWYFLGLQEMLVYFDPWIAGVVLPTIMIVGLMAIPYMDSNPKGQGYYSFKDRKMAVSIFMMGWLVFWIFLIILGTFLRGPNWNFFGPFEAWDVHKVVPLNNVNLSEYVYVLLWRSGLPDNILIREIWGFLLIGGYFLILPPLLAKTWLKKLFAQLGPIRFGTFITLALLAASLPIKMYLRWVLNLKYIIAIPEFFFNI